MAKGNAVGTIGKNMGNAAESMGAVGSLMGGGGMGAYGRGQSPMAQQKSMYSQMQPQMQMNKGMMNPGTQMQQDSPYSQNNPFIGMSRSHAMNTGQQGGYENFQNMMQPWDRQRGMSGMLPQQGQNILPPSQVQNYGNQFAPEMQMQQQLPSYGGMGIQGGGGMIEGPGGFNRQYTPMPGGMGRRY